MSAPSRRLAAVLLLLAVPSAGGILSLDEMPLQVVGVVVRDREVGTVAVLREEGEFLIPLAEVLPLLGAEFVEVGDRVRILTPLGEVSVAAAELARRHGELHGREDFFRLRLLTPVAFDEGRYALLFDPPWRIGAPVAPEVRAPLAAEVRAPGAGLSSVRGSLSHARVAGTKSTAGTATLRGRLGPGWWEIQGQDSTGFPGRIPVAAWRGQWTHTVASLGKQRVWLHPLLGGFDLAGGQVGWTNQPLEQVTEFGFTGELFPRQARAQRSFAGEAPPGSVVELRVGGIRVAAVQVGFSGQFEFPDVALPSRQASEVEILIFDRARPGIPVEVRRYRTAASGLLLRPGATTVSAGGGLTGVFTRGLVGSGVGGQEAGGGFVHGRHGLSEGVTVEGAFQSALGRELGLVGIAARLSERWIGSAAVVGDGDRTAFGVEVSGFEGPLQVFLRSQVRPGALSPFSGAQDMSEHSASLAWRVRPGLTLELTAVDRDEGYARTRFVRPGLFWQLGNALRLAARPDYSGEYRVDAAWAANPATTLYLTRTAATSSAEINRRLSPRFSTGYSAYFGDDAPTRHVAFLDGRLGRGGGLGFRVGALVQDGKGGAVARVQGMVTPGLMAALDYQSTPLVALGPGTTVQRFTATVTFDLGFSQGRVVPGGGLGLNPVWGSVAGRLVLPEGFGERGADLSGARVSVGRQGSGRVERGGSFLISGIREGVHMVELDPGGLPIELVPVRTRIAVEVRSGAVTRVEFPLAALLGIMGQILDGAGVGRANVAVRAVDVSGRVVARGRSDIFGVYRLDGIPAGAYRLQALDAQGDPVAEREASLIADYLTGVDFQLP